VGRASFYDRLTCFETSLTISRDDLLAANLVRLAFSCGQLLNSAKHRRTILGAVNVSGSISVNWVHECGILVQILLQPQIGANSFRSQMALLFRHRGRMLLRPLCRLGLLYSYYAVH